MDDFMMYKLLNENRGMGSRYSNEEKLVEKFKEFMRRNSMRHSDNDFNDWDDDFNKDYYPHSSGNMMDIPNYMRHSFESSSLDNHEAHDIVSKMYHVENGKKYIGEKYNINKAKEVIERYRGIIPSVITPAEMYVALNAQYHNYGELFRMWFGDDIEQKIIDSAIVFWFKDVNKKNNKVVEYFRGM